MRSGDFPLSIENTDQRHWNSFIRVVASRERQNSSGRLSMHSLEVGRCRICHGDKRSAKHNRVFDNESSNTGEVRKAVRTISKRGDPGFRGGHQERQRRAGHQNQEETSDRREEGVHCNQKSNEDNCDSQTIRKTVGSIRPVPLSVSLIQLPPCSCMRDIQEADDGRRSSWQGCLLRVERCCQLHTLQTSVLRSRARR